MNTESMSSTGNEDRTSSLLGSDFLTPEELCKELRIHPRTLFRFHSFGTAPPRIKVGRKTLYSRHSVIEWLLSQQQKITRSRRRPKRASGVSLGKSSAAA
jgi:predicted DNA-binding transcriptional regulator AlpA